MKVKDKSIIGRHRSPLMHFFEQFKEQSTNRQISDDAVSYSMEKHDYDLLVELENKFEQQLVYLTSGIESVGYILAIAGQNEDDGLDEIQVSSLGWLISDMGKRIIELEYMQTEANYILNHCQLNNQSMGKPSK